MQTRGFPLVNPTLDEPDVIEVHSQTELKGHFLQKVGFQRATAAQVEAQIDAGIALSEGIVQSDG